MRSYYDLSIPARSLIILAFFVIVCVGGSLLRGVYRRKKPGEMIFATMGVLVSGVLMIVYTAEARSNLRGLALPRASEWLCSRPVLLPVSLILVLTVLFVAFGVKAWCFRRNTITRSSIKEGVDKVSSGLCFYEAGGRTILVNDRMTALSHIITGADLQNAELFWQVLSGGEVKAGVERISFGSYPNFRLPDGSVWTFARETLDGIIQMTAVDTTLQQALTDELREKNLDLAALNLRLRKYGENVDELARARERLETKVRIHGELGQALLATRRYLVDSGDQDPPLDVWRRNIAMLRKETETKPVGDPLKILKDAALSAGIALEIRGDLPEKAEYRQFFLTAASEAMTNAVFHANAKTLYIEMTKRGDAWRMRFSNDGERPDRPIVEGGGLSSLRRKGEYVGAVMTVNSLPEFELIFEGRKSDIG